MTIEWIKSNIIMFKQFTVEKNKWIEQRYNPEWDFNAKEYEEKWRSQLQQKVIDTNNRLTDLNDASKLNCAYYDIRKVAERY